MTRETSLVRAFRRGDLVAFAVNCVIGAGIFGVPALLFAKIGAASIFAVLGAALAVALITLCFAEVGSRFGETGGPYLYALRTFGPLVGFEIGYLLWIARLLGFAAVINLFLDYSGYFFPAITGGIPRVAVVSGVVAGLTLVNLIGVRRAALLNDGLTAAKLIPLFAFIVVGLFFVDRSRLGQLAMPSATGYTGSVLLAVYAFSGFEIMSIPGGEIKDPARAIPFALLTGLGIVTLVYLGVQVVAVGTLPELATSTRPLADAARHALGGKAGAFMVVGAMLSTIGVAHTIVLAAGRLPFAMAEQGQLPALLAQVHPRYRTPWLGLAITSGCLLLVTLLSSFASAATFTVEIRILTYLATCAALPVLRRRADAPRGEFRVPAGEIVAVVSVLVCVGLLTTRPAREIWQLLAAIGLGLGLFAIMRKSKPS
jgi:amino acid transporter